MKEMTIKDRCNECINYLPQIEECIYLDDLDWNCGNFEKKKINVIISGGISNNE